MATLEAACILMTILICPLLVPRQSTILLVRLADFTSLWPDDDLRPRRISSPIEIC